MTNFADLTEWYENPLPKPPVPDLDHTLSRFLEYAGVVAKGQNVSMDQTNKNVRNFLLEAQSLQEKLLRIAERENNWVNKFWLPEMYLRIRLPLPVNSNPAYIFPKQKFDSLDEQIRYTAWLIRGFCEFKNKIDRKLVNRDISTGTEKVRMCMSQYDRILSCYRQPAIPVDQQPTRLINVEGDEFIACMCNNQAFVLQTRLNGNLLAHSEIVHQLREVERISRNRSRTTIIPICGGSSGNRNDAALFWQIMSEEPQNVTSLGWMQQAAFVVCLDAAPEHSGANCYEEELANCGHHILHGYGSQNSGFNRWYDATIQIIVASDGTNGICIEHSVAEGIVIINMGEFAIRFAEENMKKRQMVEAERRLSPQPLTWFVSDEAKKLIEKQREDFDKLAVDLELKVFIFEDYGKDFIKSQKISPDGFVQLSMQLAYYRLHGHLVSTYESAAIRRFCNGRVDNIRAATPEVLEWVTAMVDGTTTTKQRELLYKAAQKQALITMENITGIGIDNHLCALAVLAHEAVYYRDLPKVPELLEVYYGDLPKVPELLEDPIYNDTMRFPLSTSQVSVTIPNTYLCYGPVVRDGYGCSYNLENGRIVFAPSAFRSHPKTNAEAFRLALGDALRDMKILLLQE